MTKIEVGDTVEITEGVLKGFQAKVTGKHHGLIYLGERTAYCSSVERLKLVKKAKAVNHVYVVHVYYDYKEDAIVSGVYTTREAAETKAERIKVDVAGIWHVAVLRMTLKGV